MLRLLTAFEFAERAYRMGRQPIRKYTGEPYIVHPVEVAQMVAQATDDEDVVIAALFHDIVEDTNITLDVIRRAFGERVAQLVHEVTDVSRKEHGNRATRKALDAAHLANASWGGKTIKLADLISNTQSIVKHDPNFAATYMQEKKALLEVLSDGHAGLYARAKGMVESWEQNRPPQFGWHRL